MIFELPFAFKSIPFSPFLNSQLKNPKKHKAHQKPTQPGWKNQKDKNLCVNNQPGSSNSIHLHCLRA